MILVDGGSVVNNFGRTATVSPNPDEITEFKITGSNFSAEYGYGSNVINVSTKSGTNDLHFTLWEFLRNQKLDARNFFPPARLSQGNAINSEWLWADRYTWANFTTGATRHSGSLILRDNANGWGEPSFLWCHLPRCGAAISANCR